MSPMAKPRSIRFAEVTRETTETRVDVLIDFDGGSKTDVATGIGFFDHMLHQLAFHGDINVGVKAEGDLLIDDHHTVEDVGIALGRAICKALEDDQRFQRYGDATIPMDEALAQVALDISGRGMLVWDCEFKRENIGSMATENIREFFRALAANGGLTVHIRKLAGENDHHVAEAIFKAFGRALSAAAQPTDRQGTSSTKGKIG